MHQYQKHQCLANSKKTLIRVLYYCHKLIMQGCNETIYFLNLIFEGELTVAGGFVLFILMIQVTL